MIWMPRIASFPSQGLKATCISPDSLPQVVRNPDRRSLLLSRRVTWLGIPDGDLVNELGITVEWNGSPGKQE